MKALPVALACVFLLFAAVQVQADLDIPKWLQQPDLTTRGVDVFIPPGGMADDFLCMDPTPITDVHIWGSWKNDLVADPTHLGFRLAIFSDVPVSPTNQSFSHPGDMLWDHVFNASEFQSRLYYEHSQAVEGWFDPTNPTAGYLPNNHKQVWQYNFLFPDNPFPQQGTDQQPIIYWLAVWPVIQGDGAANEQFGWKTSVMHWNDDAVVNTGTFEDPVLQELLYPANHPYAGQSIDLAFAITPEPATLTLLAFGAAGALASRRRK